MITYISNAVLQMIFVPQSRTHFSDVMLELGRVGDLKM